MKALPVKAVLGVALVLAVLTFAPLYAHVLEWPGKDALSGPEWLATQQHLYGGYALSGGITETLGLLASAVLALLLARAGRRVDALLAALTAFCFVGMLLTFALGNNPLNVEIASWTATTLPPNWRQARDAWQAFHLLSAVLAAGACALLLALLFRVLPERPHQHTTT
jgi:hypothetical protein